MGTATCLTIPLVQESPASGIQCLMIWEGVDVIIIEIKHTMTVVCLNHPKTTPASGPRKNCLPLKGPWRPECWGPLSQGDGWCSFRGKLKRNRHSLGPFVTQQSRFSASLQILSRRVTFGHNLNSSEFEEKVLSSNPNLTYQLTVSFLVTFFSFSNIYFSFSFIER